MTFFRLGPTSAAAALLALAPGFGQATPAGAPFGIRVVDAATGRGVPLVELETVHHLQFVSDSAGWIAVQEPELMERDVFFFVRAHGYAFPQDGFGYAGKTLRVTAGGRAELTLARRNLAERLYRVTGGGIYRDSLLLGLRPPLAEPLLNGQVLGQDSVCTAVFGGRLYWFWGDTNRPSYPLGNFHVPGATSALPGQGGLDPSIGVDLAYFLNDRGFAKETCAMAGEGPTWISGVTVLHDAGRERMFAHYVKVRAPLTTYRRGLVEWHEARRAWEHAADVPLEAPAAPDGHPLLVEDGGVRYVYFAAPYPLVRVRAAAASFLDLAAYEAYTPYREGTTELERDAAGRLRYAWKRGTPPLRPREQAEFLRGGRLRAEECLLALRDADDGRPVQAHAGSVYWNAFRRRFVMIAHEAGGSSMLGEVWYAEAEHPLGPWAYARKIVTHDRYSFYNVKQHPEFDQDGGRRLYFEGTYTTLFSGNDQPTPRYDYNQIMYRLDLEDPRLALPVAVYRPGEALPAYFALDRPAAGAEALPDATPARYGFPDAAAPPAASQVLEIDGRRWRVWPAPHAIELPRP